MSVSFVEVSDGLWINAAHVARVRAGVSGSARAYAVITYAATPDWTETVWYDDVIARDTAIETLVGSAR